LRSQARFGNGCRLRGDGDRCVELYGLRRDDRSRRSIGRGRSGAARRPRAHHNNPACLPRRTARAPAAATAARLVGVEGVAQPEGEAERSMQALAAPGTSGMRPTDAARGLLGDAIHREKVTIVSSRHPDFTQETPRKLLPTGAKEAQRHSRETPKLPTCCLWRVGCGGRLGRAHNPKVAGSNPARDLNTRLIRPPLAIPDLRNRTFGRRWKLSTTRGSKRRIQIPPPRGMKFRGEYHHEITVVAPTGRDRTCTIQVREFIAR